jgi:hypothetical protein
VAGAEGLLSVGRWNSGHEVVAVEDMMGLQMDVKMTI